MQFIIITKMRQMQPLILENKRMAGGGGGGEYMVIGRLVPVMAQR